MAHYLKIETIGSIGCIILAILEIQVYVVWGANEFHTGTLTGRSGMGFLGSPPGDSAFLCKAAGKGYTPEGPDTQLLRTLAPKAIKIMVFKP